MSKYYKDLTTGTVFAFESDGSQDEFIGENLVQMAKAEIDEHLNPPITKERVSELRRLAYADPLTGSDPLYIEYQRAIAMDEPVEMVEATKAAWLDRAKEIALQYPWP